MHIAQFGSKTAVGFKPVWLGALGDLQSDQSAQAQIDMLTNGYQDFGLDLRASARAPMASSPVTVRGKALCHGKRTQEEWGRELKKFVGYKDWLVGYRGVSCQCGRCSRPIRHCNSCGTSTSVAWFAKRARYQGIQWTSETGAGARVGNTPGEVSLTFEPDTHWMRMTPSTWAFGIPETFVVNPDDPCIPLGVTQAAWPCNLPLCLPEPPFRWYRNLPANWIEAYCVGYWSAEGWKFARIGTASKDEAGDMTLMVEGDIAPLNRWAFTNFTWLRVTICTPAGWTSSFTINQKVAEPQYALIDPRFGAEVRYCPLHDDHCYDTLPTAEFADIASNGAPLAIAERTTSHVGKLWPGANYISFTGWRLPGHPFAVSYDIVPQYV